MIVVNMCATWGHKGNSHFDFGGVRYWLYVRKGNSKIILQAAFALLSAHRMILSRYI